MKRWSACRRVLAAPLTPSLSPRSAGLWSTRAREIRAAAPTALSIEQRAARAFAALERPSLRRVINATGVVLHTNLGRAPLGPCDSCRAIRISNTTWPPAGAASAMSTSAAAGTAAGRARHRGQQQRRRRLPGAQRTGRAGGEAIVSRGELIEIGDGFRIPEIMAALRRRAARSGNHQPHHASTTIATPSPTARALLLRVHPSNFRITGFTARPAVGELAALGRERGMPVYEDFGSGCLADLRAFGIDEPLVADSLQRRRRSGLLQRR